MVSSTSDRRDLLKRKHQIAIKQLDGLHGAISRFTQTYQTSPTYPHVRLATVRAFELAFHALCDYVAEKIGMVYEFEQPEYGATQIFETAYKKGLITQEEYVGCMELIAVFGLVGEVFDGDVAEEVCHDIEELFPVMCTIAQYTPEDLNS